jgi:hypothetical protein
LEITFGIFNGTIATNAVPALTPVPTSDLMSNICRDANVRVEYGNSDVKDRSVTVSIILINIGVSPCLVKHFPYVRLLDATGKALEINYQFFKEPSSNSYLLVEPQQSVGFLIVWKNWCLPPATGGIRIRFNLSAPTV